MAAHDSALGRRHPSLHHWQLAKGEPGMRVQSLGRRVQSLGRQGSACHCFLRPGPLEHPAGLYSREMGDLSRKDEGWWGQSGRNHAGSRKCDPEGVADPETRDQTSAPTSQSPSTDISHLQPLPAPLITRLAPISPRNRCIDCFPGLWPSALSLGSLLAHCSMQGPGRAGIGPLTQTHSGLGAAF